MAIIFASAMYYLLLAIFYPLSLLPFWALYILSDGIYVIVYKWVGYRIEVVRNNLLHAFPEKTDAQRKEIEKKFYRSFCDQWIETIKLISISKEQMKRHFFVESQPFIALKEKNISCYALMAHNFNFEWANVGTKWQIPQTFAGIYMPISNKAFGKLMYRIRSRAGTILISASNFRQGLQELQGQCYALGLVSDQNPANKNKAQWEMFLNREAPFYRGPAEGAIRNEVAVAFAYMHKVKRGYYKLMITILTENAATMTQPEITHAFVQHIEQKIKEQPENYLWTHKRWKHKKEDYVN